MGSDAIALPMLEGLVAHGGASVEFTGIFTQPDRRSGRGMKLHANPVKQWAENHGIAIRQPQKIEAEDVAWLSRCEPDLIIVMSYGHILRNDVLAVPKLDIVNLHASLLPKYRGASPIEAAIAAGDEVTGVTLMRLVRKMDAGPILDSEKVPVASDDTPVLLREKIARACVPLMWRGLPCILSGEAQFTPQDESKVTYTRLLEKNDAALDFHAEAGTIANRIRALQPWPGAWFDYDTTRVKIAEAYYDETPATQPPGQIVKADGASLDIATGAGILKLTKLQRPGGRMLPVREFLNGFPVETGKIISSHEMRPLSAPERFIKPTA